MAITKKTAKKATKKVAPKKIAKAPAKRAYKRKPKAAVEEIAVAPDTTINTLMGNEEANQQAAAAMEEANTYEAIHLARQERYLRDADVLLLEGIGIDGRVGLLGWLVSQDTRYIYRGELTKCSTHHFVNELLDTGSSNPVLGIKLGERGIVSLLHRGDNELRDAKNAVQLDQVKAEFKIELSFIGQPAPQEIWHGGAFYSRQS